MDIDKIHTLENLDAHDVDSCTSLISKVTILFV